MCECGEHDDDYEYRIVFQWQYERSEDAADRLSGWPV